MPGFPPYIEKSGCEKKQWIGSLNFERKEGNPEKTEEATFRKKRKGCLNKRGN